MICAISTLRYAFSETACQSRDRAISVAFIIGPRLLFGFPLFINVWNVCNEPLWPIAQSQDWLHYFEIGCTISRLAALSWDWRECAVQSNS